MGHLGGKGIYKQLGNKIDGLTMRAPWNDALYQILKELYTREEAEIVVKMPYGLSSFERVAKVTQCEEGKLRRLLDSLCSKGLVVDLWMNEEYMYMPSPMAVGIFEMTMMRTEPQANHKTWARLFHDYLSGDGTFFEANFGHGEKASQLRTLAHEEAIDGGDYVEVLDYEGANSIIEESERSAIGYCSCRHEKFHLGEKACSVPLNKCSSFGLVAEYLVRRKMAREASKSELLENIAQSKELKLVLAADNIKQKPSFICHCCQCCCNVLVGINTHGFPNILVSSSYISGTDEGKCTGCEKCAKACPISAIEMVPSGADSETKKRKAPKVNESICLGCGVCGLACPKDAVKLVKRGKRVFHPETTFERVILQSLDRGTLQNQLFDNPQSITHKTLRGILGAFLRLSPVKRTLMSDLLRSRFLASMKAGVRMQGHGWLTEI